MTDFAAIAATWPDEWRIRFEERAAIREYDGGEDRRTAERMAFAEIVRFRRDLRTKEVVA